MPNRHTSRRSGWRGAGISSPLGGVGDRRQFAGCRAGTGEDGPGDLPLSPGRGSGRATAGRARTRRPSRQACGWTGAGSAPRTRRCSAPPGRSGGRIGRAPCSAAAAAAQSTARFPGGCRDARRGPRWAEGPARPCPAWAAWRRPQCFWEYLPGTKLRPRARTADLGQGLGGVCRRAPTRRRVPPVSLSLEPERSLSLSVRFSSPTPAADSTPPHLTRARAPLRMEPRPVGPGPGGPLAPGPPRAARFLPARARAHMHSRRPAHTQARAHAPAHAPAADGFSLPVPGEPSWALAGSGFRGG